MPNVFQEPGGSKPLMKASERADDLAERYLVLGVPISVENLKSATDKIVEWALRLQVKSVFLRDVHGVMRAVDDVNLMQFHEHADLVLPDGTPLMWIGKTKGFGDKISRVPGVELFQEICRATEGTDVTHYFYGGQPGVAQKVIKALLEEFPKLKIAGYHSPPMRSILSTTLAEDEIDEIDSINRLMPGIIWVGLSTPKQEYWMSKSKSRLRSGIMLGIGAAFDFYAGDVKRAPKLFRDYGLEWLYRLIREPRRLWYRYLVLAPRFVILLSSRAIFSTFRKNITERLGF